MQFHTKCLTDSTSVSFASGAAVPNQAELPTLAPGFLASFLPESDQSGF
jgi:hypothetical protein